MEINTIVKKVFEEQRIVIFAKVKVKVAILLFVLLLPYVITTIGFRNNGLYGQNKIQRKDSRITTLVSCQGGTYKIDMETYLIGRLAAVIPAEYEEETLKAQTILLRTLLIREYKNGLEQEKIKNGCIDTSQSKYYNLYEMKKMWGADFSLYYKKIKEAVKETKGIYITYQEEPIVASYFRVSDGKTNSVEAVLGNDNFPYLKSVVCAKDYLSEDYLRGDKVSGLGHGFGMSQFGANEMAKTGATYDEIVCYFFTDITIDKFE